jgi:hypothetical protein
MKSTRRTLAGLVAVAMLMAGLLSQQGDVSAAASLTSKVEVLVTGTLTNPLDLTTATAPMVSRRAQDFANGVGAGQADVIWSDSRTLATGATEDIDLVGGGLTDAFGVAVAPAKLRALIITAATSNTTNLTLFGDAASPAILNTAATTFTLQPGGMFVATWPATAGVTVTATTADILQVVNAAGASATYTIIVIGTGS